MIPRAEYDAFLERADGNFNVNVITEFAEKINILPGIIIGRLQQEKQLSYQTTLNSLKVKYTIG